MDLKYPAKLLFGAMIVTAVCFTVCLAVSFSSYRTFISQLETNHRLLKLRGDILVYNSELTSAMRLAAASGNEQWIINYQLLTDEINASFEEILSIESNAEILQSIKETVESNQVLASFEKDVSHLVMTGQHKQAEEILDSEQYSKLKQAYATTVQQMIQQLEVNDSRQRHRYKIFLLVMLVVTLVSSFLLATVWYVVNQRLAKWRDLYVLQQEKLGVAEQQLRENNRNLEKTVKERTAELENSKYKLQKLYSTDELTGIGSRNRMINNLNEQVRSILANADDNECLLLNLIDIDQFGLINETFGHEIGDELLQSVANRLKYVLNDKDQIMRIGGDQFAFLLRQPETESIHRVDRVMEQLKQPYSLAGGKYNYSVNFRIGVTVAPKDGTNAQQLIRNADIALSHAKQMQGSNRVGIFDIKMKEQRLHRREIESGLRQALKDGQFSLHYQPKIDLNSNELIGAEALIRWKHPELGFVPPDKFIPIAEETGLIIEIGEWVLNEASRQVSKWRCSDQLEMGVAINVSPLQLRQAAFIDCLKDALKTNSIEPQDLQVEVTESSLIENDSVTRDVIHSIANMGCELALDDFGTGFSSLSYLKQYPFDYLKIDRSFVNGLLESERDQALTQAIITLARSLDLKVISEGTEIIEQCNLLKQLGCDMAQGYYYSRPLPADEFLNFARQWDVDIDQFKAA